MRCGGSGAVRAFSAGGTGLFRPGCSAEPSGACSIVGADRRSIAARPAGDAPPVGAEQPDLRGLRMGNDTSRPAEIAESGAAWNRVHAAFHTLDGRSIR